MPRYGSSCRSFFEHALLDGVGGFELASLGCAVISPGSRGMVEHAVNAWVGSEPSLAADAAWAVAGTIDSSLHVDPADPAERAGLWVRRALRNLFQIGGLEAVRQVVDGLPARLQAQQGDGGVGEWLQPGGDQTAIRASQGTTRLLDNRESALPQP